MKLAIDISPLRNYPNYRWLYIGQFVSFFGSMITYVAIPFQVYQLTKSTFHVGMLGIVQLIPLVIAGLWGGAIADVMDRRKIVIRADIGNMLGNIGLIAFTLSGSKDVTWPYLLAGLMALLKGFERPAMESLTQQLIPREIIPKVSSLQSFKTTFCMVAGPAIGGLLAAKLGPAITYAIDFLTYLVSVFCLWKLPNMPPKDSVGRKVSKSSISEGMRFAWERPHLLGTYLVDMIAMTFAFPNALFPALADVSGHPDRVGQYFAAPAVGAFFASVTSAWTWRLRRHGRAITWAALGWCLGMSAFGLMNSYIPALICLALAGASDMISGVFRATVWNQTIPENFRGRLASVEMISYSSGPLLGNALMGFAADKVGPANALIWGGVSGGLLVLIVGISTRPFWNYQGPQTEEQLGT